MNNYIIYADVHRYAKYESELTHEKGAIYLGDIYDLAGCKKREVNLVRSKIAYLKDLVGDRYPLGNHELKLSNINDQYIANGILFTHGHLEFWGLEKSIKYMSKKPGKGAIGRAFSSFLDSVRVAKPFSMSEEQKNRCWDRCMSNNCHTMVLGHKHPAKLEEVLHTVNGQTVRIIVLPRGRNVVEL